MRLLVTSFLAILSAALGAVAGLYLAMWVASLISAYEPGAHTGLLVSIFMVPLTATVKGWIAATVAWKANGRSQRAA